MHLKQIFWLCGWSILSANAAFAGWNGSSISGSQLGTKWEAMDMQGKVWHAENMQGKVSLFFFGFTQCPDICPTTLANASQVFALLDEQESKEVQIVMVSVDPERDTAEVLKHYLGHFPGNIIGLTGSPEQIKAMQKNFKVFSRKVPMQGGQDYTMEHSSNLYLFDKQGRPRLLYYSDVSAQKLAQDMRALLEE